MRFSDLEGASVGVWGAGREIRSFLDQLSRRLPRARVAVAAFDRSPGDAELEVLPQGTRVTVGAEVAASLAGCDAVIRSPGVSIHRPEVEHLLAAGIPITTATGLWLAEQGGHNVIAITGTKGKSTTAALAHHLARAAGCDAALAGNIGVPALDLLDRAKADLIVLELSSYQIADLTQGPEIAVITNLYREHLDWHGTEERYRAEKLRLFGLPGVRTAVVNGRVPELVEATRGRGEQVLYGMPDGWDCDSSGVRRDGELIVESTDLPLPGPHNALNLCAALAALEAATIEPPLPEGLAGFTSLPHRLAPCGDRDGVSWIDDSISTTPESTLAALDAFDGRDIVLLAGGQDRGQDYAGLGAGLADRGTAVVGIPTTGARVVDAARSAGVPAERAVLAENLNDAVALARRLARPGSIILLSPAAPSYDHFRNFEERGTRFVALAAGREGGSESAG